MKNDEKIRQGHNINIEINDKQELRRYHSKVEEIIDDKNLIISAPVLNDNSSYLSIGQIIGIVYNIKNSVFSFDAEVVERQKSNENISIRIKIVSDIKKIQRRNYFRLNIMISVIMKFQSGDQGSSERTTKTFDTFDISGGGIRVVSRQKFDMHSDVWILVNIPGIEREVIEGRVVRAALVDENPKIYQTGIEFTNISVKARQTIIQYIFAKQRELIKRGISEI